MRRISMYIASGLAVIGVVACTRFALARSPLTAQPSAKDGAYSVVKTAKVGGDGGFDYVYADSAGRRLYVARSGQGGHVVVFNLDTLEPAGDIPNTRAHGAASDAKTHHAFASSKPVAMWDTQTMALVKTIDVDGGPDGILNDEFNHRTYVFSHGAPNATVIDDNDGKVLGTIDLGGAPEQAASDGNGHLYIDLEDQASVAVVDTKTMKLTGTYSLNGKERHVRRACPRCAASRPLRGVPESSGDGNAGCQYRQVSRRSPNRSRLRRRDLQPQDRRVLQFPRRWHADDHQGKQPDLVRG